MYMRWPDLHDHTYIPTYLDNDDSHDCHPLRVLAWVVELAGDRVTGSVDPLSSDQPSIITCEIFVVNSI